MRALLFGILVMAAACGVEPDCRTGEMRCLALRVQTCNADNEWVDWLNCGASGRECFAGRPRCAGVDIACCD